ncbi:hypothetical protein BD626DRAFT_27347 [Schizophyllum amplum]|uniref:Secreted protein n=1 Tax=Schizophyllum amplum TaxID=97359 RepID=A0A550CZW2_9AGAR|nr:hypothetical protein BD626DRAFT_27347 [Auriculariopsis ampla]
MSPCICSIVITSLSCFALALRCVHATSSASLSAHHTCTLLLLIDIFQHPSRSFRPCSLAYIYCCFNENNARSTP